jgi:hypothetical protein
MFQGKAGRCPRIADASLTLTPTQTKESIVESFNNGQRFVTHSPTPGLPVSHRHSHGSSHTAYNIRSSFRGPLS